MSLTTKMFLLTMVVGVAAWAALDNIQTRSINTTFRSYLAGELAIQAQTDRLLFDEYIKLHSQAARLFVSQTRFDNYVEKMKSAGWERDPSPELVVHTRPPEWFPRLSVARAFMHARYTLLIDPAGRVRELFESGGEPPPEELLNPSELLRQMSHNQTLLTSLAGTPYIIASETARDASGNELASLMLASPIDDILLVSSQGIRSDKRIVVMLAGDPPRSLATTRPDLLPTGTSLEDIQKEYIVAGKSFFDYGSSDLRIQFTSLVPLAEAEKLTEGILPQERRQRAITALALLASFVFVMFWITARIRRLNSDVQVFSKDVLGVSDGVMRKGDELAVLMDRFRTLTREVIAAREALKLEAEEKIALASRASEARLIERERNLLHHVMEILGVGVISSKEGSLEAANEVMEEFARDCGGLPGFVPHGEEDFTEIRLPDRTGHDRYFTIVRFYSQDEEKDYILVHDVTDERRAVEALKESESRARAVTDTATDAIIMIDQLGRITYWNPAAQKTFGYTSEEAMGKDVHDLLSPPKYLNAARKAFLKFTLTGEGPAVGITRTLSALKKDGTEFPVELSLSSFRSGGKLNSVGLVRDITERVKAEEDKAAMFNMLTHDIKGPLSIIYGYSELLAQSLEGTEDADMIAEMQKAGGRISALIDDMLALSRLESGRARPVLERASISEVVNQAVMDCISQAREMGVTVDVIVEDDPPPVMMDRKQIIRAIGNLAANAVNYNRAGGKVVIRAGTAVVEGSTKVGVFVEVMDTGVGIPEEDLGRVFDKYYRSSTSSTRRGTGLGLAIVKAAVEAHGGSVSVTSKLNEGSKFRVELPADQEAS